MGTSWAFSWVQIVLHNQKPILSILLLISALILPGLAKIDWHLNSIWIQLGLALVLMSLVAIKLMDSVKTAGLMFGFSLYSLSLLLGLMGWFSWRIEDNILLALVVVLTMMMSNLIHVLTGLHREMARGNHQYDAVAESLSLNILPILLSNVTTILGFMVVAYFNPQYSALAWAVLMGFLVTLFVLLTGLPLVLLNWLLEFRVGNVEDRQGFLFVADWLKKHRMVSLFLFSLSLILTSYAGVKVLQQVDSIASLVAMLGASFLLLWWVWHSFKLSAILVVVSFIAVVWSYLAVLTWLPAQSVSAIIFIIPFGIILDDGIHFFTRVQRGSTGFYPQKGEALIRFTLSSVGRPIWNTSILLIVGLSVLTTSSNEMVLQASWMTMSGIITMTLILVLILPIAYIRKYL